MLLSLFEGRGPVTEFLAGSTFEVSWYIGSAHPVSKSSRSIAVRGLIASIKPFNGLKRMLNNEQHVLQPLLSDRTNVS